MPARIGLISDPHATPAPLAEALSIFSAEGVDLILCAGDIAGYGDELEETVELLIHSGCRAILGNHELWHVNMNAGKEADPVCAYFRDLPHVLDLMIEGKKLHMVHASPPRSYMEGIKLLDENGVMLPDQGKRWTDYLVPFNYDILVVGHTHQVFSERLGNMLVINPGSTKFNHTCAILDLPDMAFQLIPLSSKTPVMVWNWGMNYKS
ncbi:MAG: metallophosphoesterase family protein [Gammaproteobacteria bacterium]